MRVEGEEYEPELLRNETNRGRMRLSLVARTLPEIEIQHEKRIRCQEFARASARTDSQSHGRRKQMVG
jgi:hypothetical protein